MRPRPNPTQHTVADEREWRQLVRLYCPPGQAQDAEDLALAFDQSNQRSWAIALRKAALAWVREHAADRFIVRKDFVEELREYATGAGEFPDDAQALDGEDQLARRFKRAKEPAAVAFGPRGGVIVGDVTREDLRGGLRQRAAAGGPDEEGRFPGQEPRGRFARSGDPGWEADSR